MKNQEKKNLLFSPFILLSILYSLILVTDVKSATTVVQIPDFYYYYTEKVYLNLSTELITTCFQKNVSEQGKEALIRSEPILKDIPEKKLPSGLVLTAIKEGFGTEEVIQAIERLNTLPGIKYSTPVFEYLNMKLILMDEFVVRFKPDISEQDIQWLNEENRVEVVSRSPYRHNRYVLRVKNPKDKSALEMANIYNQNPQTEYATPNFLVLGGYHNTEPNDSYFQQQWALNNDGQSGGTHNADMDAPEGWDITIGDSNIVIAIIDSGTDIDHEDLSQKIWVNEAELNGIPGVDDDGNGYIDDIYGWNFENGNNDPRGVVAHGTACAGLAAAETNNEIGIAGVCWEAKIMPLKIGTSGPITSAAADAVDYASNNGADVLSNSWGVPPDADLTNAIVNAKNNGRDGKGCVIVFASGNDGWHVSYPAVLPEVVAVGATDEYDVVWDYSNYGLELDVVAPSGKTNLQGNIWTTDITGEAGYNNRNPDILDYTDKMGGTSAATPQVAGLAALILSVNPDLTSDEVQSIIESTADDKGYPGWDQYYGWGRINIYNAVVEASKNAQILSKTDGIAEGGTVDPDDEITYTIHYFNPPVGDPNYIGMLTDVNIIDYLPEEVNYELIDSNYNPDRHSYTWNIGTLEPNESGSVMLTVVVNELAEPLGTITNLCVLKANEICPVIAAKITDVNVWNHGVIYVDVNATGSGTGMSWDNAYTNLQDALERAGAGCGSQIWVAEGTYKPTDIPSDTSASFELVDGIPIYGGFPSGGGQRNWIENETILDGYLGQDNALYVVLAQNVNEATILDGFTIKNGYSRGIYCCLNSNPNIINCTVGPDSADSGIGIYCSNSDPNIINCDIWYNHRGGLYCEGSNPNIINCNIENNPYTAISCYGSNPNITNCVIANNNESYTYHGGIYCSSSSPIITNCTFRGNQGSGSGGIYSSNSSPTVTNCILWDNSTEISGSGVTVTYSDIKGSTVYPGTENIKADPCFYNPSDLDSYHLSKNSRCIDAGNNSSVPPDFTDLDGDGNTTETIPWDIDYQGRIIDGNDDGNPVVDMGADEYYYRPADFEPDGIVNFIDYAMFARFWQIINPEFSLDGDNDVDYEDLRIFCEDWLWTAEWYQPAGSMMMGEGMGGGLGSTEEAYLSASAEQKQPEQVTQIDIEKMLKWLEELWLDPEVKEVITEDEWLEFVESVKSEVE